MHKNGKNIILVVGFSFSIKEVIVILVLWSHMIYRKEENRVTWSLNSPIDFFLRKIHTKESFFSLKGSLSAELGPLL